MSFSPGNAWCLGVQLWSRCFALGMLLALSVVSGNVVAEDKPAVTATPTALPQRGALASSTDKGFGTQLSPSQWGGLELEGKGNPPLTASVYRGKRGNWELKVFNNSEDLYSATVTLEQLGTTGARVKIDSFTLSLGAGQYEIRSTPAHARSTGATANLVSWRKTAKRAPQKTPAPLASAAASDNPGASMAKPKPTAPPSGFEEWPQRSGSFR